MTMFFAKKLNKKGFTLAELLIVVAIIAVLVAIAVPIFAGALKKARIGVHTSNARALKSEGVVAILSDPGFEKNANSFKSYTIEADYDFSKQTFGQMTITPSNTEVTTEPTVASPTSMAAVAVSASGDMPTNGTGHYTTYVNAQDISTTFSGSWTN